MAHFAHLDDANVVLNVIVVSNHDAPDPAPTNSEPLGQAFIASTGLAGRWVQTSYNGTFRGRYANVGDTYDEMLNMFIVPQPYPSWTLDDAGDWQPPTPMPDNSDYFYEWDEDSLSWVGTLKPTKPNVATLGE